MFRYLLPAALCFALLAAASARAEIHLASPEVTCTARLYEETHALVLTEDLYGHISLRFDYLGEIASYPVIYSEPGLIVAKQDSNLLLLRHGADGKVTLRASGDRADGSADSKASLYDVSCGPALRF